MKVNLNLRNHVHQYADNHNKLKMEASIDVDALFETAHLPDDFELELDELLQQNRIIAHLWTIDDVREVRPQLTDDQAWEVLQECEDRLDSTVGINWDQIEQTADDLFGAETQRLVRFNEFVEDYTGSEAETNLVDLLADAMHWCRIHDADFEDSLATARLHFQTEVKA